MKRSCMDQVWASLNNFLLIKWHWRFSKHNASNWNACGLSWTNKNEFWNSLGANELLTELWEKVSCRNLIASEWHHSRTPCSRNENPGTDCILIPVHLTPALPNRNATRHRTPQSSEPVAIGQSPPEVPNPLRFTPVLATTLLFTKCAMMQKRPYAYLNSNWACRTVVLKVWSPDQQQRRYLGTHEKCRFSAPPTPPPPARATEWETLGVGPSKLFQAILQTILMLTEVSEPLTKADNCPVWTIITISYR